MKALILALAIIPTIALIYVSVFVYNLSNGGLKVICMNAGPYSLCEIVAPPPKGADPAP
jgi:hypothetical protein